MCQEENLNKKRGKEVLKMNMERNEVKQCKERERDKKKAKGESEAGNREGRRERNREERREREIGGRNNSFVVAIYSNSCLGYR